ncbi:sensor histidine kinase [Amycolatopsis sp. YIM 10]|uniref:sensor histidine kinase n=1 Tax=Amycolatopsis sp. YIM 10 TaxID=2653857 RepID=UPI001290771E|nr:sensor histidine kinase [Amycolatopsis sp. YIM 10]
MPARPRLPPRLATVLAWTGLVLSPVVLHLWIAFDGDYDFLPFLAMVLPIGVLRRVPLVALGALLLEMVSVELIPLPLPEASGLHQFIRDLQTVTVDLAVGYVAATRPLRVSAIGAGLALVVQLVVAATTEARPNDFENAFIPYVLAVISAWAIGYVLRQGGQYRQARREQAEIQAVQAERLRIARELHDMIAHSIGVIAFQAGMGGRVIDTQPEEARKALNAIEDTSRETLTGLRQVLGALRSGDPVPGLGDLDDLVTRTRDAGVRVEVRRRGDRRALPPEVGLAAFRVIQEAVTNVVRHAGVDRCEVVVDQRDEEVVIEVTDDGRGDTAGAGYGLSGMRERVTSLRGEFTAGPRAEGGFRVSARIPAAAR